MVKGMKSQSLFTNELGFHLPFVLFIALITLSVVSTIIIKYENELVITDTLLEQIENETLIQMGRAKFKDEHMNNNDEAGESNYTFPSGNVRITYNRFNDATLSLLFSVE